MLKIDQFCSAAKLKFLDTFFQMAAIPKEIEMKPKPDEAQNTKFSWEERSLLICQTTFKISKFEKWPHPVRAKTKMDFHVSLGFHGRAYSYFHSGLD